MKHELSMPCWVSWVNSSDAKKKNFLEEKIFPSMFSYYIWGANWLQWQRKRRSKQTKIYKWSVTTLTTSGHLAWMANVCNSLNCSSGDFLWVLSALPPGQTTCGWTCITKYMNYCQTGSSLLTPIARAAINRYTPPLVFCKCRFLTSW